MYCSVIQLIEKNTQTGDLKITKKMDKGILCLDTPLFMMGRCME